MTNAENSDVGTAAGAAAASAGVSAGTLLRQAREAAGLHIAALAVSMKVPVKKLEALESDRLDLLPDAVFARALAASMCRTLKIDPAPVLEKLPGTKKVSLTVEARISNQPFNARGHTGGNASSLNLGKTAMFTVIALLLAVALVLFVPQSDDSKNPPEAAIDVVEPHFPIDANKPPVEELITPAGTPLPSLATSAPAASAPAISATPMLPKPPAPVVSAAPAPVVSAPAAVSANPVVVFKARGSSWVEVTDAKGLVQLRRTMEEGEMASAAGTLPIVVVVGRVDMTDVAVRGKPFDVSKVAVGNVARFEVK
jgi:cytoskeleton protein RodZ